MANFTPGSRYTNAKKGIFRDSTVVYPNIINYSNISSATSIIISAGNEFRPDLISLSVYGRDDLGWYIMGFNNIDHVQDLKAGLTLKIAPVNI